MNRDPHGCILEATGGAGEKGHRTGVVAVTILLTVEWLCRSTGVPYSDYSDYSDYKSFEEVSVGHSPRNIWGSEARNIWRCGGTGIVRIIPE